MSGGFDTASYIQSVSTGAVQAFGTPSYWIRYFSPCQNGPFTNDPVAESQAAWNSGGKRIGIVTGLQGSIGGSPAQGQADARTLGAALQVAVQDVPSMSLSALNICWLDVEPNNAVSSGYWSGWAGQIISWHWHGGSTLPLGAGIYLRPCDSSNTPNCVTVQNENYGESVWSQQPQICSTLTAPPSFQANNCTSCAPNAPASQLWQFRIATLCGPNEGVDLDLSDFPNGYGNYCLVLNAYP